MDLYSRVRDAQEALYEAQMGYDAYARANHEGVTDELLKLDHAWLEIMGLEVGRACLRIEDDSKRLWFASKRPDPAQLARQLSAVDCASSTWALRSLICLSSLHPETKNAAPLNWIVPAIIILFMIVWLLGMLPGGLHLR